jgi:hypothetical protein
MPNVGLTIKEQTKLKSSNSVVAQISSGGEECAATEVS